jgi:hypothetical protein
LVLEADGYQPYLFSPEKGLRALIRQALDLVKEPAKMCVDEVGIMNCPLSVILGVTLSLSSCKTFVFRVWIFSVESKPSRGA